MQITINELNTIIKHYFNFKDVSVKGAWIAETQNQHHPKDYDLGAGSVLNIVFDVTPNKITLDKLPTDCYTENEKGKQIN